MKKHDSPSRPPGQVVTKSRQCRLVVGGGTAGLRPDRAHAGGDGQATRILGAWFSSLENPVDGEGGGRRSADSARERGARRARDATRLGVLKKDALAQCSPLPRPTQIRNTEKKDQEETQFGLHLAQTKYD